MNKSISVVTSTLLVVLSGCAGNGAKDNGLYDNQWSKPGATEDDFNLASHDCRVEEHQRTAYDRQEYQQAYERDQVGYRVSEQTGRMPLPSQASMVRHSQQGKNYWLDCMTGHSWRVIDKIPIEKKRGPDGEYLDYDEMGLTGDTNSFKATPAKP